MLRQLLILMRLPKPIISTLDHAIMHGIITQKEWISRRFRTGSVKPTLLSCVRILSEGSLQAFLRLERVEENTLMRSKSSNDSSQQVKLLSIQWW